MMINDEQIEGHFQKFLEHWSKHYAPQMIERNVPEFEAGRMFQELWLDWKLQAEIDYLENSGQLNYEP